MNKLIRVVKSVVLIGCVFVTGLAVAVTTNTWTGASGDGKFWAGVYDPVGKRGLVPDFSLKAKDAPTEWKWVDVCTLKLDDNAYFWVGAGRYDKTLSKDNPAYVQLWIDTFEVVRKAAK